MCYKQNTLLATNSRAQFHNASIHISKFDFQCYNSDVASNGTNVSFSVNRCECLTYLKKNKQAKQEPTATKTNPHKQPKPNQHKKTTTSHIFT